jgi:GMP synthase (glutamine-hydrolysing)
VSATLLILKTGSTLEPLRRRRGDFDDWFRQGLGQAGTRAEVCGANTGDGLPPPEDLAGVIVTGSPAMVSDRLPWSERAARWLREAVRRQTPILGVCYGHQLLAHALGGRVGLNPRGREIGTVRVRLAAAAASDPLLGDMPAEIEVQATHLESVLEPPPGAEVLGATELDPHHVLRFSGRAWGLQFHPEFDREIVTGYITERRSDLEHEGLDAHALVRSARDTPHGTALLRRFAALCTGERVTSHPSPAWAGR